MPQSILPALLKKLEISFSQHAEQTLQDAPQGSFEALARVLDSFKISSMAVRLQAAQLAEIDLPAIVQFQEPNQAFSFAFIKKIENDTLHIVQEKSGAKTLSLIDFLQIWTGNTLLLATDTDSTESNYTAHASADNQNRIQQGIAVAAISILGLWGLWQAGTLQNMLWLFLQYIGLGLCILLLLKQYGKPNEFVDKLCKINQKTNCDAVLSSSASKIFGWLSWAELGLIYFLGYVVSPPLFSGEGLGVGSESLGIYLLPLTLISIYYQWRVLKNWCVLCLAVVAVLWLSAGLVCLQGFDFQMPVLNFSVFAGHFLAIACWFILKPFIEAKQEKQGLEQQIRRFRENSEIFKTFLESQNQIDTQTWENEIQWGNVESPVLITMVSNPFCQPCALTHTEIKAWAAYFDVRVQVRFTPHNEPEHEANRFIKHLLSIQDQETQEKALADWYELKNYDTWAAKYPTEILADAQTQIEKHANWCNAVGIYQTPTIFINGYLVKEPCTFEDLKHHLRHLVEGM